MEEELLVILLATLEHMGGSVALPDELLKKHSLMLCDGEPRILTAVHEGDEWIFRLLDADQAETDQNVLRRMGIKP